ncbi:hypothetical protein METBIDRAFT_38539 [Metschnikowia bicuspidata var. bicuspidata NRRL YB-4993]|uniref:Tag1-like fifth Ig-like domain-containing protein n=1 Tax=Metschnikowia bicuspidata var. bicuspidata NRRL YB-4993 TaxID=869754 RepID=A0A1A0HFP1_9ASCO|nr:hypothetical protein METBIDRAFT_38539 [Metschnikowia bicuspidata var. bicuspidata NRRL YB-4993]OBA22974.1 hypothetical protein METBIDRAFT_38539 [Metschnikowia bicuspidata var. bicuspidata NRRL YB-4993]
MKPADRNGFYGSLGAASPGTSSTNLVVEQGGTDGPIASSSPVSAGPTNLVEETAAKEPQADSPGPGSTGFPEPRTTGSSEPTTFASSSLLPAGQNDGENGDNTQVVSHLLEATPPSDAEATEATPLILGTDLENWAGGSAQANSFRHSARRFLHSTRLWKSIAYILALAVLMLVLALLVDFQKLANDAFSLQLQNVSVLGIHDDGVALHVTGTVETNYARIGNPLLRHATRLAALVVGGVVVAPRDECRVYVTTDNVARAHLLDMYPPEMPVDLIDHRVSEVDFITDAVFVDGGAALVFESILSHSISTPLILNVEVRLAPKIQAGWFSAQLGAASLFQQIEISSHKLKFPLEVHSLAVSEHNGLTNIRFASSLPAMPMSLGLGQIDWQLAIADCDSSAVAVGEWRTSILSFDPTSPTNVTVFGTLDSIPLSLLETCSDGLTPVNRFIHLITNEKTVKGVLSAKHSVQNSKSLPKWLYSALTRMSVNASIPTPHMKEAPGNIPTYEYTLYSSNVVAETLEDKRLHVRVDAKADVGVKSSSKQFSLNFSATHMKSKLFLSQLGKIFLEALVSESAEAHCSSLQLIQNAIALDCRNVSVWLTEPRLAGRFVKSMLIEQELALPQWAVDLDELKIQLRLLSTVLKDLRLQSEYDSPRKIVNSRQHNSSFLEWLMKNIQLQTYQIFCVSSSPEHAEFLIDFQISNPLNASVAVINDILKFDLKYNKTTVAVVLLENFLIPNSGKRALLSASMTVFYSSSTQRVVLEDFISHVISGSDKTRFGIAGTQDSSKKETDLSRFLQEIEVEEILLPELNFTHQPLTGLLQMIGPHHGMAGDFEVREDTPKARKSPFLIDATFHLWTSEMELTVFNPISNVELKVRILDCLASYKGEILAHVEWSELLMIPPGIHATSRIPIKIANGIGADTLRKALNGDLAMDVVAELSVSVDKFPTELMYRGAGLTAKVRI